MEEINESLQQATEHLYWCMMAIVRVRHHLAQLNGQGKGNGKGDGKSVEHKGKGKGYGKANDGIGKGGSEPLSLHLFSNLSRLIN